MTENEIIARGIVAGMAIVLPFLGMDLGKWHSWKGWSKFWQMMHKDLQMQNERLFKALTTQTNLVLKLKRDRNWESSQHHKYKRCSAMAEWCESEENRLEAIAPIFDTNKECWEYNSDYWNKWRQRWLKIAEKFK